MPPPNSYTPGPPARHTIRSPWVQPHRRRQSSDRENACAHARAMLRAIRHVQRSHKSLLVIAKGDRDASLLYAQAGKHIVLLWSKRFLSHAQCLLAQYFVGQRIVSEHSRLEVESHHTSLKTIALLRKVRYRGIYKVHWIFTLACAAYNLVRLRNLAAQVSADVSSDGSLS